MSTITIKLAKPEDEWLDQRVSSGAYGDPSDYVAGLIRKDRDHEERIAELQAMIADSLASGISPLRVDDIIVKVDRRRRAT